MKVPYTKVILYCKKCKKDYPFNAMKGFEKVLKFLHCPKYHYSYEVKEKTEEPSYEVDIR